RSMTLLHDWVADQADRRPDAPAVIAGREQVSYGSLEARSNQLARILRDAAGCRRGDRVAVLMPKSPKAIVAILAIYKADCVFVPLDGCSPAPRLAKILESCEGRLVLAEASTIGVLDDLSRERPTPTMPAIGWLDREPPPAHCPFPVRFTLDDLSRGPTTSIESRNSHDAAAHILF